MQQSGFTYLEMVIVVIILGMVAAATLPNLSASDPLKLDIATEEIKQAIDFARSEAIRTKITHGLNFDATNERIRVYQVPSTSPVYDVVFHPIDKKIYDLQLKNNSRTAGVNLQSATLTFTNGITTSLVDFSSDGLPKNGSSKFFMLTSGVISLAMNKEKRTLTIAPMTGRVTVQ